jgi:hypothetical protein
MSELTPEKAVEIVEKICGPEGLEALEKEIQNTIEGRKARIQTTQGEINAFLTLQRTIQALRVRWGIPESKSATAEPSVPAVASSLTVPQVTVLPTLPTNIIRKMQQHPDEVELERRLKNNVCTYKDQKTKKWCRRRSVTETQKKHGFCRIHLRDVAGVEEQG